jgi:hypothetical protein
MCLGAYVFKCLCFRPEGTLKCHFTLDIVFHVTVPFVGSGNERIVHNLIGLCLLVKSISDTNRSVIE